ncbi:hypothetical protein [Streptomyces sp. NPDC088766]|uniref:hypothetical protein n=1 Tax=Streptomyces sp. NPDC088766 TaxID=3365893 RepID=UPI00383021C3
MSTSRRAPCEPDAGGVVLQDYYEVPVDLEAVIRVYALRLLTQELVASLNPEVDLTDLVQDVSGIGCPQQGRGRPECLPGK